MAGSDDQSLGGSQRRGAKFVNNYVGIGNGFRQFIRGKSTPSGNVVGSSPGDVSPRFTPHAPKQQPGKAPMGSASTVTDHQPKFGFSTPQQSHGAPRSHHHHSRSAAQNRLARRRPHNPPTTPPQPRRPSAPLGPCRQASIPRRAARDCGLVQLAGGCAPLAAATRRARQRFRQQGPAAVDQLDDGLRKLAFGAGAELRLDDVAGDQHRPHAPAARAADISAPEALDRGSSAEPPRHFRRGREARRRWLWYRLLIRADGNNRRAGAPSPG